MQPKLSKKLLVLIGLLSIGSTAQAGVRLSLLSEGGYTMNATTTTPSGLAIGGGTMLGLMFSPKVGIEAGGIILSRSLTTMVQVPLNLRIDFSRGFSMGLGGHMQLPLAGGTIGFGAQADLTLALHITPSFAFIIGPAFNYVITDTPNQMDFLGRLGFRIGG